MAKYYAFVYGSGNGAKGGMNDYLDSFDSLPEAKAAVEQRAPQYRYWLEVEGHVVSIDDGSPRIVAYYVCHMQTKAGGGNVIEQHWGDTRAAALAQVTGMYR
jgi:hypothetical protein